jgi:hypothetical protein
VRAYVEPVDVIRKSPLLKFSVPAKHQCLKNRARFFRMGHQLAVWGCLPCPLAAEEAAMVGGREQRSRYPGWGFCQTFCYCSKWM